MDVVILMGSKSDEDTMSKAEKVLDGFGVTYETHITSAHRSPERTRSIINDTEQRGAKVFIAAAGLAAHLAGMVAAHTDRPVIGVPMEGGPLKGLDALLSTAQMPKGVPVSTMAIGSHGAINAALTAVRILALSNPELAKKNREYIEKMEKE